LSKFKKKNLKNSKHIAVDEQNKVFAMIPLSGSVVDPYPHPDPYVFGLLGSASRSVSHK
jgi:hypothetical protein